MPDVADDLLVGFVRAEDLVEHHSQVRAELAVVGGREVVAEVGLVVELTIRYVCECGLEPGHPARVPNVRTELAPFVLH